MWKEKLWQVFLVIILGFVLTMCNRSASNNNSSNSGTLNADGTTTVTVSSLPSVTIANAGPSAISHTMFCDSTKIYNSNRLYYNCDASDDTEFESYTSSSSSSQNWSNGITQDNALAAGWKLVGSGCGTGSTGVICTLFHK